MSVTSLDNFTSSMTMPGRNTVLLPNQAGQASCLSSAFAKATADQQQNQQQIQRL